jgi:hypothetical protein
MLNNIFSSDDCKLYLNEDNSKVEKIIATTAETRLICNDPFTIGIKYTRMLQKACSYVLSGLAESKRLFPVEHETIVFNVLRGGLNFGLREALADAFNWNEHGSAFISAQRARISKGSEHWHITESHYKKVYVPKTATVVLGDVVATGTSLQHAMDELIASVQKNNSQLKNIVFFTIGAKRSEEIIEEADKKCRELFPEYEKSIVIYFEGCFKVADTESDLFIKITGTDLLRVGSLMAPEFIESQYKNPSYPLERCTIYDAGSRAFWLPEYLNDVQKYWESVLYLADTGITYKELLNRRFPELDYKRFGNIDLKDICKEQLAKF